MVAHPGVDRLRHPQPVGLKRPWRARRNQNGAVFCGRDDLAPGPLLGHIDIPFFAQTLKYWISQKLDSAIT